RPTAARSTPQHVFRLRSEDAGLMRYDAKHAFTIHESGPYGLGDRGCAGFLDADQGVRHRRTAREVLRHLMDREKRDAVELRARDRAGSRWVPVAGDLLWPRPV